MQLQDQIVVITGGASGLGKACAEAMAKQGAQVVVWDRESHDKEIITCDVSSDKAVEHAMQTTIERVGIPRACVHCAGVAPAQRIVGKEGAMPLAAFKQVIDINLVGTFNVLRVMAEAMMRLEVLNNTQERGVIINTASIAAYEGQIGQIAYSASKGGVVAMTLPAARELAKHGIRVNTIAPGLFATPLLLNMPQEVQDGLAATVPFPARLGHPDEFAALAIHLIENTMINGEVIRLDGALRMQAK